VKAFLDTSVLVAAFYGDHVHHEASLDLLLRFPKSQAACAVHSLAETYSVLTGMPGKDRATGEQAMQFLDDVRTRVTPIALGVDDYAHVLREAEEQRISGGAIFDALIARCAKLSQAQHIYTWNEKDFRRLGAGIASRVRTP
jgi:predicted nucleic acid-binding protein